jgi:hypothetical protein
MQTIKLIVFFVFVALCGFVQAQTQIGASSSSAGTKQTNRVLWFSGLDVQVCNDQNGQVSCVKSRMPPLTGEPVAITPGNFVSPSKASWLAITEKKTTPLCYGTLVSCYSLPSVEHANLYWV